MKRKSKKSIVKHIFALMLILIVCALGAYIARSMYLLHTDYLIIKKKYAILKTQFEAHYKALRQEQKNPRFYPFYPISNYEYDDVDAAYEQLNETTYMVEQYEQQESEFYKTNHTIFAPKDIKASKENLQKRTLLFFVHGTYSDPRGFGANLQEETSKYTHIFAKQLAQAQQTIIEMITIQWTGNLQAQDRQYAGQELALTIKTIQETVPFASLWLLGHSHGCNVINNALQELKDADIIADNVIFIGSPQLEVNPLEAATHPRYNARKLYNFWGSDDVVAHVGSLLLLRYPTSTHAYTRAGDETIRNIRIQDNGKEVNHTTIKKVVLKHLAALINLIGKQYPLHFNLDANITKDSVDIAIREDEFIPQILYRLPLAYQTLIRKSRQYSRFIKQKYRKTYGSRIQDSSSSLFQSIYHELKSRFYG